MIQLAEKIINGDPWRRLVAGLLTAIIVAGGPVLVGLWSRQGALSERIARLEEYRDTGPSALTTDVELQKQRVQWAESMIQELRRSMGDIRGELQSISRQLDEMRRLEVQ